MKRLIIIIILAFFLPHIEEALGAGQKEAASYERARYLVEEGIIVPPDEVVIDSFISQIDYNYPAPDGEVGVTLYSGYRQVSTGGQEEIVQVGIQASKTAYEELPSMNLAILIDKSASMRGDNKYDWVADSFDIFIDRIRDKDFVSLVIFDKQVRTSFSPSRMDSQKRREMYKNRVHHSRLSGGTDLTKALRHAYDLVQSNYRKEYINRVILLTDGVGIADGILNLAHDYSKRDIYLSTVGYGTEFNLPLMMELAEVGGGSSRFISGKEEMEETFGSELDRMVAPVALNLEIELTFLQDVEILGTWGYDYRIEENVIRYSMPALHNGDYETILVQIQILGGVPSGMKDLASVSLTYNDIKGTEHRSGPHILRSSYVDVESPIAGFSDSMVLRSGSMLHFAQALKEIGGLVYASQRAAERIAELIMNMGWGDVFEEWLKISTAVKNHEVEYGRKILTAYNLTLEMHNELHNAGIRLETDAFTNEIGILDTYIDRLRPQLYQLDMETALEVEAEEPASPVDERSLNEHLENLFREMSLDLEARGSGTIAVSGFSSRSGNSEHLTAFLNEKALLEIMKYETMRVVERDRLEQVLEEQKLSLSDLTDTTNAIQVGRLLAAGRILTGTVIEMANSVVIFGRIVNVETAEVESAAQVIVPIDRVREALL